jgi:xylulose-5-phosphate/fructose-6-phosphate phosphoketolase
VIPVLHINGFKISERTIFGCMDDKELTCLFSGYGYQVCIVKNLPEIDDELSSAFEWALSEVRKIQEAARSGEPMVKPRWPMIALRTPKVRISISAFSQQSVCINPRRAGRGRRL